jgi:hypothetical protein
MTPTSTSQRVLLPALVIAALAIAMGFAVSLLLTSAIASWDTEHVAAIVQGELGNTTLDALFEDATPDAARERWQALISEVVRYIPGVVRCKVWSRDRVVLWSDDSALIGRHESNDPGLGEALAGRVVFRLVAPDSDDPEAAWHSQVLSRIHVPMTATPGAPARGVIELRKIPTRLSTNLKTALFVVWSIAAAGALALWLVLRPRASLVTDATAGAPRQAAEILAEIRERFGFVPPFFEPAIEAPTVLENLWRQTRSAYIENPLPALFKEKLFAYLSRYCAVPYCIVCHSCALRPLGMTAAEVLRLLEAPPRGDGDVPSNLTVLSAQPGPLAEWPTPGAALETALIDCSIFAFVFPDRAERCQRELRRLLGADYPRLAEFLAYVRSCHAWVEAHPELAYEADQRAQHSLRPLVEQEPRLAEFFRGYRDVVLRERETSEARRLAELETRAAALRPDRTDPRDR